MMVKLLKLTTLTIGIFVLIVVGYMGHWIMTYKSPPEYQHHNIPQYKSFP